MEHVANTVIDQTQVQIIAGIVGVLVTGFFGFLTFIANKIGVKAQEYFNRDAIETAANRYANSIVDLLQERYLGAGTPPKYNDLIREGLKYIKKGNPDAVEQSGITDDRLTTVLKSAINSKVLEITK